MNKRLFCAEWIKPNDPMEGMFAYSTGTKPQSDITKRVMEITNAKAKYKVCSLSSTYDRTPLIYCAIPLKNYSP